MTEERSDHEMSEDGKPTKPSPAQAILDMLKKPGVIATVLGAAGLVGPDVVATTNQILSMDLPAWTILAMVGFYIAAKVIYDLLTRVTQVANDVRKLFQIVEKVLGRLEKGDGLIGEIGGIARTNCCRLDLIEVVLKAEIEAYREKTRRETGKVDTTAGPPA